MMRAAHFLVVLLLAGCGKSSATGVDANAPPDAPSQTASIPEWEEARSLDEGELARLALKEGATGLADVGRERDDYRVVALAALAYVDTFSELPWLTEVAEKGTDTEASVALDSVITLAARRRMSVDPEDADELHDRLQEVEGNRDEF